MILKIHLLHALYVVVLDAAPFTMNILHQYNTAHAVKVRELYLTGISMSVIYGSAAGANVIYGKNNTSVAFGGGPSDYPSGLGSDADCVISGSVNFQQAGKVDDFSIQFAGGKGTTTLSSSLDCSGGFTISMWAKNSSWAAGGSTSYIMITTAGTSIHLTFMSTSHKKIRTEGGMGDMRTGALALDTWYNIVIRNDGTNSSLWVDGVEAQTASGSMVELTSFVFGIDGTNYPFDGYLDSFSLFTREISDAEVATLFNSGSGNPINSIDTTGLRIWYNFEQASTPITNQAIP